MPKVYSKQFPVIVAFVIAMLMPAAIGAKEVPDTVKTGVYITSIHNIDFKAKEYTISLWLWLKYKRDTFNFLKNLEIPSAKTVSMSFSTVDTTGGMIYLLMKLQCVMKDEWKTENFPFDHQNLRFSFENSQFDSRELIFEADTAGNHFDPRFTLRKWRIDSITISTGKKIYETAFGDSRMSEQKTVYSNYKVKLQITRNAMGLFWKMFLGMYLAFLIAFMCFFIHVDSIDSRFGLAVGALFAVVGNKYIVDSALPESTTFTLVDTLHGITLFFVLVIMVANSYVLTLAKREQVAKAKQFDRRCALISMVVYLALNFYFIYMAHN